MRVTKLVDIEVEVDVDVGASEFIAAIYEFTEQMDRAQQVTRAMSAILAVAVEIPDALIAELAEKPRELIAAHLEQQSKRYALSGTDRPFDFAGHLLRQRAWSEKTFGPGPRTAGVLDHIAKELAEIRETPEDLTEWIDVVILALDGAWRTGATPLQIIDALVAKQTKNERREWPDWRSAPTDRAIEHVRR